jgi:hypothetical protein
MGFLAALPLSVELLGAIFSIADGWRSTGAKADALERLALPLFCWGGLWWLIGVDGWPVMLGALSSVLFLQVASFYAVRLLISRPRLQTQSIDTDADANAT